MEEGRLVDRLPHERLWAGDPKILLDGCVPVVRQICCGSCGPEVIDCIEPVLQVLIRSAAWNLCTHTMRSEMLCPGCGEDVLLVAERAVNSTLWEPTDEDSTVRESALLLGRHKLIDDAEIDHLINGFVAGTNFSDDYLRHELGLSCGAGRQHIGEESRADRGRGHRHGPRSPPARPQTGPARPPTALPTRQVSPNA